MFPDCPSLPLFRPATPVDFICIVGAKQARINRQFFSRFVAPFVGCAGQTARRSVIHRTSFAGNDIITHTPKTRVFPFPSFSVHINNASPLSSLSSVFLLSSAAAPPSPSRPPPPTPAPQATDPATTDDLCCARLKVGSKRCWRNSRSFEPKPAESDVSRVVSAATQRSDETELNKRKVVRSERRTERKKREGERDAQVEKF